MANPSELNQFTTHERLLWRVLATLARHGFVTPPDEGRDLIHDFYVEAWPGVLSRFDGARSAFTTYMSSAFYKFARRRIVRLQNLRYRLVDLDSVAEHASLAKPPSELVEEGQQIAIVRNALDNLPARERAMLREYLEGEDSGERALARKFSLSRYAVREELANAVGRFAAEVGKLPASTSLDAQVANQLWKQGRSPKSAAAVLGVNVSDVNAAKHRLVASLLQALRTFDSQRA